MTRARLWGARLVALAAVGGGAVYLFWRLGEIDGLGATAVVFFAAELVNYLALIVAVVLFWTPHRRPAPAPPPHGASLDVFIPVCGEHIEMVESTLRAALAIDYPHETHVLLDARMAGHQNWPEIVEMCNDYHVRCLMRASGPRGKAGNLNAALPETDGEFIVVLDADHLAYPDLGERLLGYFADPDIAFVTSRQCFRLDNGDLLGHQEALFYSAIQPAKDRDNAAFSCGNGVAYRRAAIEDIGGFSEWNLVEDLHTSFELHARGWRSAYVSVPVSVGTAPATAAEMANQRLRWATDSLRMFFWDNPLLKHGLTLRQRLHYLHTTGWYLVAAAHLVFLISPIASILLGAQLLRPGSETTYGLLLALYLGPVALLLTLHVGWRAAVRTAQLQTYLAPVFALAVPRALLMKPGRRSRATHGGVTRKTGQRQVSWVTLFQHGVLVLLLISVGVAIARPEISSWAVVIWACVLAASIATPGSMLGQHREVTQSLRIAVTAPAIAGAVLVGLTFWSTQPVTVISAAPPAPPAPAPATAAVQPKVPRAGGPLIPAAHGIYLGVFNRAVAGPPKQPVSTLRYSPAKMRILHRFQAWWGPDRFLSPEWLEAVTRRGAVPMVSWEPWLKPKNSAAAPHQRPGIVRQIAKGRYDLYVRRWARDARAFGKPMVIRLMHEMNGSWYPWSVGINRNTAADFKAAWRRVHRIFRQAGASNVSWVFSVDSFAGGTPTSRGAIREYYPGARYVDWVGLSGFNWSRSRNGGVLTYERVFRASYDVIRGFDKPVMLAELGTASVDTQTAPTWVRDVLTSTPTRFPRVKAIVWYDSSHPQRDFRLRGAALSELRRGGKRPGLHPGLHVRPRG
jgi:cellulose synthase (UDP-forming)